MEEKLILIFPNLKPILDQMDELDPSRNIREGLDIAIDNFKSLLDEQGARLHKLYLGRVDNVDDSNRYYQRSSEVIFRYFPYLFYYSL